MPNLPVVERIDRDLEVLIERFFEISRNDLVKMHAAIDAEDFETLVRLGHTAKGSGYGYGFKGLGMAGQAIETAAQEQNLDAVRDHLVHLEQYLDTVRVEFK